MFVQTLQVVQTFAAYSMLLFVFSVGTFLKSMPAFRDFIIRAFDVITRTKLPVASYWDSLFSDQMFENVWHSVVLDLNKKIKKDREAPNSPVVSLSGKHCFPLLQMAKSGRPLVLNFGSCTCPIFMSQLDAFQKMANEFSQVADFCVVYIEEAHPSDGWALKVSSQLSDKVKQKPCTTHILDILNTFSPFNLNKLLVFACTSTIFSLWMKTLCTTNEIKAIQDYIPAVLFIFASY